MSSKHTPGPWSVAGRMGYGYLVDPNICVVYGGEGSGRADDGPANALLIAAAPEMLEALKALHAAVKASKAMEGRKYLDLGIQVNSAIAKAEGRS